MAMLCACVSTNAQARDQIRMAGSSTVYPFITIVAEEFGSLTRFKTPIVEATGTGGGFKLFCSGIGDDYPDFANASRPIKDSELVACAEHHIAPPLEIKLGYDGIVLANAKGAAHYDLTKEQLFRALAASIPNGDALIKNTATRWNQIAPELPDQEILIYGPPPTSGTRDAFAELVMEAACVNMPAFLKAYPDETARKAACKLIREDGHYVDAGENDNLIVQKLIANPHALGIFGYSFLEENTNTVQASKIEGVAPDFDHILDGSYGVSRSLFTYAKREHFRTVAGMRDFITFIMKKDMLGQEGLLAMSGLIPMPDAERKAIRSKVLTDAKGHDQ